MILMPKPIKVAGYPMNEQPLLQRQMLADRCHHDNSKWALTQCHLKTPAKLASVTAEIALWWVHPYTKGLT